MPVIVNTCKEGRKERKVGMRKKEGVEWRKGKKKTRKKKAMSALPSFIHLFIYPFFTTTYHEAGPVLDSRDMDETDEIPVRTEFVSWHMWGEHT